MDISELKQELLDWKIRPFYVFTGNELAIQDIYIEKISEISGLSVVRADSVSAVYSKLTAKSLVKSEPSVFVIRDDDLYRTTESSWKKFIEAKSLKGNILILLYTELEKSSKFMKAHDSVCTKFDFVGGTYLKNRIQAMTKMPIQYCDDIVKMCGNNYGRILNELYKLETLTKVHGYSMNTAYLEAKKQNMIHEEIGDIIFDFTDSIVERNIVRAYNLWPKMKYTEDGPMRIITVLYNTFRQIYAVQSCPPELKTEETLGMTKGQIYITGQKCNRYTLVELDDILRLIREIEKGIKIGTIEEKYSIDYLMGKIWQI